MAERDDVAGAAPAAGHEHEHGKVRRSEEEWRRLLGPQRYHVLREKGTERAFTGEYWDEKREGLYRCAACGKPLFSSSTKFESGSGWPSFYQPMDPASVREKEDRSLFMRRTEVLCDACGSHLGHVFPDGPRPTGMRYCINSLSLDFEPEPAGATEPKSGEAAGGGAAGANDAGPHGTAGGARAGGNGTS